MKKEVLKGKSPAIRFSDRKWNDENVGVMIKIDTHTEVDFLIFKFDLKDLFIQKTFNGQTFCIRTMFTEFMVDASNIFSFERVGDLPGVEHALEWWIFKPSETGQQVL